MLSDDWHLTEDVDDFLARAGDFLCSRAALHNTPLTDLEKLRVRRAADHDAASDVFGRLESAGEVRAVFYLTARGRLGLTPLPAGQTEVLAARLAEVDDEAQGIQQQPRLQAGHVRSVALPHVEQPG